MIRVIHIVGSMDCGGTENLIMNLYRNIDRSKVQFDFIVHTHKKCFFDDEIRSLGGQIFQFNRYSIRNLSSYRKQFIEFFNKHPEYKIMHGHVGSTACIYTKIAKKSGLFTIIHSHAINNKNKSLKNYLYRFHAYMARGMADAYFGCSYEAGIDRFGKKITDSNKYRIINNAIKSKEYIFNPITREIIRNRYLINDKFVIGHVGRFHPVKNHKFMLQVLSELCKLDDKYVLMLVGDGELKESILQMASNLNLEEKIILTGICKNVAEILQGMDFFIFPSFNEGLGISLIEAQASGLPCIANADGVIQLAKISELVKFLSINDGPKSWASYIHQCRSNNYPRNDMSKIVEKSGFDITFVAKNIQEFYIQNNPVTKTNKHNNL